MYEPLNTVRGVFNFWQTAMRINEIFTEEGWDLFFRRLLNDWEVERLAELLGMLLDGVIINTNATDRMLWKHNKDVLSQSTLLTEEISR